MTVPTSARSVLANQPDFVADVVATYRDGSVEKYRLAKRGKLFRLEYLEDGKIEFVDETFLAWELDPSKNTGEPVGRGVLVMLVAPWIGFSTIASVKCFEIEAAGADRDRAGRPRTIKVVTPDGENEAMVCSTSGERGLITRIEIPNQTTEAWRASIEELGARRYELKNVRYDVPAALFAVPLEPQPRSDDESWLEDCAT